MIRCPNSAQFFGRAGHTAALALLCLLGLVGCGPSEPPTDGGPAQMSKLSEGQYRNTIADIFGSDIVVAGRFDPMIRPADGLLADGAALVSVSQAGLSQYEQMARGIALQVVDERHRDVLLPCDPAIDEARLDTDCATNILTHVARLLFRRPVTADEIQPMVDAALKGTRNLEDPFRGLAMGLAGLLVSPDFLFRIERTEPDPNEPGHRRLDAFSKATRISFLLWNTTPDEALLAAAENGELDDPAGLETQVERLVESPRFEDGMRAFFADMFGFEGFEEISKDALLFPKFSREVARDAEEQMLRTIVDLVVRRNGDYRDLFTTRSTFMSRPLGMIYRVLVATPTGFEPYTFPDGGSRAGIQSLVGFVSMHSHSGRSSPTLRGKAIRELLMCQQVPDPPSNVDFGVFEKNDSPKLRTARGRLTAHRTDPTCAGCHKIMDPIGLALENFDTIGEFRATENGEKIDASGVLDGVSFDDPVGLGQVLHDSPSVSSCVVDRAFEYANGRPSLPSERDLIAYLVEDFKRGGYRISNLFSRIATSDAYYRIHQTDQVAMSDGRDSS